MAEFTPDVLAKEVAKGWSWKAMLYKCQYFFIIKNKQPPPPKQANIFYCEKSFQSVKMTMLMEYLSILYDQANKTIPDCLQSENSKAEQTIVLFLQWQAKLKALTSLCSALNYLVD